MDGGVVFDEEAIDQLRRAGPGKRDGAAVSSSRRIGNEGASNDRPPDVWLIVETSRTLGRSIVHEHAIVKSWIGTLSPWINMSFMVLAISEAVSLPESAEYNSEILSAISGAVEIKLIQV